MSLQFSKPASVKKTLSPDIAEELAMLRALHKTPAVLEKQKNPQANEAWRLISVQDR
jgi:hypothetical protein